MTHPAPTPATPQQQQPTHRDDVAALAAVLAGSAPLAAAAATFASLAGVSVPLATAVLELAPVAPARALGPAGRLVAARQAGYRAAYLLNAASRVRTSITAGMPVRDALAAERRFADLHAHAQANRTRAAQAVDREAARRRSTVLGWKAVMDARTSSECADADGRNFDVTDPPAIGYPGMVHPACRCRPVAAFTGGLMVGEAQQARKVAVA